MSNYVEDCNALYYLHKARKMLEHADSVYGQEQCIEKCITTLGPDIKETVNNNTNVY